MSEKIIFTTFTDPMMGLTYEMEPIYDRLKREYGDRIEFRWVMSLLVKDVSDFMTPRERAMVPEAGIRAYNARLAQIYKREEAIGSLPIHMEGFCLFDVEHRTSKPLNLAYKAAQLADPEKADDFLINLRHATVIDCRPTTHMDVILDMVLHGKLWDCSQGTGRA
ncbi:MAG: DsbA family protein, partial [Clostridia bacterium]|nr:DsbA family protein [Clostridia bacterium]